MVAAPRTVHDQRRIGKVCSLPEAQLRRPAPIEFDIIVEIVANDLVALAGSCLESLEITNHYDTAAIFDQSRLLQNVRHHRDGGAGAAKHICQNVVRHRETPLICAIGTDQEPTSEPLFQVVSCVTACSLGRLNQLHSHVPEGDCLEQLASSEFIQGRSSRTCVAGPRNQGVYPV